MVKGEITRKNIIRVRVPGTTLVIFDNIWQYNYTRQQQTRQLPRLELLHDLPNAHY